MDLFSEVAFKTSKIVTKSYSTSFSATVSMLGNEMQNAITSIYGFVRFADEIVDTFHQNNKKYLLEKFENDLKADTEGLKRIYFYQMNSGKFNDSVKNEIIQNIEAEFKEAKKGIVKFPGKTKLAVYIAFSYYQNLLKKLNNTPADKIASTRVRISDVKKY